MRGKNRKIFELSTIKKYKQYERKLWCLPLACLLFSIIWSWKIMLDHLGNNPGLVTIIGIAMWLLWATVMLSGIPYLVGKTGIMIKRRIAIQNCTITSMQDFDYYRDKLTGLSPATISILTDLEIEQKKDVAASILQYENLGLLVEEANHTYRVTEKYYNYDDLRESDRYLIEHLTEGDFDWENDTQWKTMAMNEAFSEGYITSTTRKKINRQSKTKIRYVIKVVLIVVCIGWFLNAFPRITELRSVFEMVPNTTLDEHINFVWSQPNLVFGCVEVLALFLLTMVAILYNPKERVEMHSHTKIGFAVILVWLCLIMVLLPTINKFSTLLEAEDANFVEQVIDWCGQPKGILECLGVLFLFIYTMWIIAYVIALLSPAGVDIMKSIMHQIRRTEYGNQMAECVYGMKNFIHDYSNLNVADRQQVVLWEDYLVYAVVLEENEEIVNEISKTRRETL